MNDILSGLNDRQKQAVECTQGPLLILAGAGSGKTRVLACRIAHIIRAGLAAPWEILALTFTNKAAEEMRRRIKDLVGDIPGMRAATFHAAAAWILREHAHLLGYTRSFVIYDDSDQLTVIKNVMKDLNMDDAGFKPRGVLQTISRAKNEMTDSYLYSEHADNYYTRTVAKIYLRYQERLQLNNALDFDDMLLQLVRLFREQPEVLAGYRHKFRYILVDEYQDTNRVQYEIVRLLAADHRNLCVVGDDDQSIYQFRGADLRNILDFERDWPDTHVVKLEENYRSTGNILDAAYHVVKNNIGRKEKKLWTKQAPGDPIVVFTAEDEHMEARYIAGEIKKLAAEYGQYAVLYRTNAQSRTIEDALVRENISYQMVGGVRFWERKEIKDILAYLRLLDNPADDISLLRVINVPRRGIGAATLDRLIRLAGEKRLTLYEAVRLAENAEIGAAALRRVSEFRGLLENLLQRREYLSVDELAEETMLRSGYLAELRSEGTEQAQSREENLREFLTVAQQFMRDSEDPSLTAFLTQLSLISDLDSLEDNDGPQVVLLTMHAAKGMEFPVVFVAGMEEGLFPHQRAFDTADGIEEERRLCYVGITRAKRRLYLTHAARRNIFGMSMQNLPSRFLAEIPDSVREQRQTKDSAYSRDDYSYLSPEAGGLTEGDRVEHGKWGIGEIRAINALSDGDTVLTIFFPELGLKKVIARYAPLRKVN